jgi:hypothetical protein
VLGRLGYDVVARNHVPCIAISHTDPTTTRCSRHVTGVLVVTHKLIATKARIISFKGGIRLSTSGPLGLISMLLSHYLPYHHIHSHVLCEYMFIYLESDSVF